MRKFISLLAALSLFPAQAQPVQRIVTLAPHATELAFAAGLGNKIVAVSDRSDYPKETENLEKVASYQGIKIERILALQPDLVIAWPAGNPLKELEKLRQLGIPLYESHVTTLDDIALSIEKLSQYADDPAIGLKNAQQFRQQLAQLKQRYQNARPVPYFYQLSEKPIITMAQDSWPSEVFRFCGGVNVFENSPAPYPQVGLEQVLLAQPEVIFSSRHAMKNGDMWLAWSNIPAVQHHNLWTLTADWINRPTPRTLLAITEVCEYFDQARQKD